MVMGANTSGDAEEGHFGCALVVVTEAGVLL